MEAIHADGSMTVTSPDGGFTVVGEYATIRYQTISLLKALDLFEKTGMEVRRNYLKSGAYWLEQTTGEKFLTQSNRLTTAGRKAMRVKLEQIRAHIENHTVIYREEQS